MDFVVCFCCNERLLKLILSRLFVEMGFAHKCFLKRIFRRVFVKMLKWSLCSVCLLKWDLSHVLVEIWFVTFACWNGNCSVCLLKMVLVTCVCWNGICPMYLLKWYLPHVFVEMVFVPCVCWKWKLYRMFVMVFVSCVLIEMDSVSWGFMFV